jgi:hypothetical protein
MAAMEEELRALKTHVTTLETRAQQLRAGLAAAGRAHPTLLARVRGASQILLNASRALRTTGQRATKSC